MNQRNTNVDFKSLELFPIEAYTDYSHGMTPISTRTKAPRHEQTHARAKAQIRPKRTPITPDCPDRNPVTIKQFLESRPNSPRRTATD